MIQKIEVGKLFKENITYYKEQVKFDITDNGCDLFICFSRPTSSEINSIKKDILKIGYYIEEGIIFLLFKFGNMEWMDTPYSIHLSKYLTKIQDIEKGLGLALNVMLVDSNTGILKAFRLLGLPHEFSINLTKEIEKQKLIPFNINNYDSTLNNIYRKNTTNDFVKKTIVYII